MRSRTLIFPATGRRTGGSKASPASEARKLTGVAAEIQSSRKKSVADSLKEMEDRQKADKKVTMGLRLIRAGLNRTPRDFYMASAVLGGLLGAVSLLLLGCRRSAPALLHSWAPSAFRVGSSTR